MESLTIRISIDAATFLSYYQGKVRTVAAQADNGKQVAFPANVLKPFVKQHGIHGHFKFEFDENGKIARVKEIRKSP